MRPGRAARAAHRPNELPPFDKRTGFDVHFGAVRVAGHEPVAMVNLDDLPIRSMPLAGQHQATCSRVDGRAHIAREIQARMQRAAPTDGVVAEAKPRSDRAVHGPTAGDHQRLQTCLQQARFDQGEEVEILFSGLVQAGQPLR